MAQADQVTTTKKLNSPRKEDAASWVSDAVCRLQHQPVMIINSFAACGISDKPLPPTAALAESQQYPDTDDELEC